MAVGLAVAALGSAPARAQEDASLDQAVVLFQRAEQRFRQGDYETAATLLREAIALEPAPPLYFNLGRALEELGDLRGAREAYESFLELAPEHPERATVEARVVELTAAEARADAEAARAREEAEARAAAEAEAEAAREAPTLAPRSPDAAPWILAGAALIPLGVGVVFGVLFEDAVAAARAAPSQADAGPFVADAELFGGLATASFVLSGVLAVAGTVWGLIDLATLSAGDGGQASVRVGPGRLVLEGAF
ncbi:MAG: hypothetical protein SangKO_090510 [Sandaracinaceae bacterium]